MAKNKKALGRGLNALLGSNNYLNDMDICQKFAQENRMTIANEILKKKSANLFFTVF